MSPLHQCKSFFGHSPWLHGPQGLGFFPYLKELWNKVKAEDTRVKVNKRESGLIEGDALKYMDRVEEESGLLSLAEDGDGDGWIR